MFALKHKKTGILAGFSVRSLSGDFSSDVAFDLNLYSNNVWVTTDIRVAQKVANSTVEAYNATFDTPMNDYAEEFEVVELTLLF